MKANGRVKLSPDELEIPECTISPAMDYLAYDILKRIDAGISEERKEARRQAIAYFEKISSGEMSVEDYGESADVPRISIGVKPPVL